MTTESDGLAQLPARTLLEEGKLPFRDLLRFAAREGRRSRPIYQVHKWFARRLGSSFRALLIGAVSPRTANFWQEYYETGDLNGVTVLDPFVGGGTSVVEAKRLGASALGVDVDPIACAITEAELAASSLPDIAPALRALQESVGKRIAAYHQVRGPHGKRLTALHHFWVQVVRCEECGEQNEAHPNFILGEEEGSGRWAFCRSCHEVHPLRSDDRSFTCRACSARTNLDRPFVEGGTLFCKRCSHAHPLIAVGRMTAAPPTWKLFAIEACDRTTGRSVPLRERLFMRATDRDRQEFSSARRALQRLLRSNPAALPNHAIRSHNRADTRLTDYGYSSWTELFNERQLLHLALLGRAIQRVPAELRMPLGLAFSNHLTTNCMLTAYAAGWRRLTPLFSIRAFRHVPRPVEINPWVDGTGRGSFPNAVHQLERAAEFSRDPKEPSRRGGFIPVAPVTPERDAQIFSGSACELTSVPSNSVDIVLTDPPYFDNVAYSELSDFFQPWLEHLGLVPNERSRRRLVTRALHGCRGDDESALTFARELGEAFAEVQRVLKPNGLLAFTFRHSTADAWFAMGKALAPAQLRPRQVLPLPGEAGGGLQAYEGTSLWDAVLVFRKEPGAVVRDWVGERELRAARANAVRWRDRFRTQKDIPFNQADFANLFRASIVAASLGLYGVSKGPATPLRVALEDASRT